MLNKQIKISKQCIVLKKAVLQGMMDSLKQLFSVNLIINFIYFFLEIRLFSLDKAQISYILVPSLV
ncbi:transmembrane protein, putative (macronuclear) [Tetrahymena thermophila SB210]|uniref:Transmembrane protein, putative n=1 Tax=Tetrahymena thermophila (strain SB210) TaxID=312017 RepID=W7X1K5_TETTS|nr:transmembrane protein, putative [Tetrahymena thermophila SB210]EWS71497.1 transmembrane protein, putative [Tetrahymena thermophila SB210]|eukprot:XP_012655967.1 transmembrane protein, putative [Tetrahymena thermophila SB210]